MKVLVAQIGARRHYAVPRALHSAGCLETFITDACGDVPPWSQIRRLIPTILRPAALQALLKRDISSMPLDTIQGLFIFFIRSRFGDLKYRSGEPMASFWARQNEAFCLSAARKEWGNADTLYACNGAALEIFRLAKKRGMKCILDQTAAPWRFNTGILLKEMERWHGWEESPADADLEGSMVEREEAEWELADTIICGSSFVVNAIDGVGGPVEKCQIVKYSSPAPPDQSSHTPGTRSTDNKKRILFVGTLQLRKGIQYLWEATVQLDSSKYLVRAVGESHLTPSAKEKIGARLELEGRVLRSKIWSHYRWADVFVLPTLSEGSSNACHEAQSLGLPVITTKASGLAGDEGHVVFIDKPDGESIACSLEDLAFPERWEGDIGSIKRVRTIEEYGKDLVKAIA